MSAQEPQSQEQYSSKSLRRSWKASSPTTKLTVIFTGTIALATVLYCLVSAWQLYEIHRSADTAHDTLIQLQAQQRPYMWLTAKSSPTYALNKDLLWTIDWGNYGVTPALKVQGCTQIAWGPNILLLIHPLASMKDCTKLGLGLPSATVAPPGFHFYSTASSYKPLSQNDISTIEAADGNLIVVGFVQYTDTMGQVYTTSFCDFRMRTGAIAHCDRYNDIK